MMMDDIIIIACRWVKGMVAVVSEALSGSVDSHLVLVNIWGYS